MGQLTSCILALSLCGITTSAQTASPPLTLEQQLAAGRSDLILQQGKLSGDGAAKLRAALQPAQYVFLGEDHGLAEVADFAGALYAELQPLGFNTVALEVGPYTARALSHALASRDAGAQQAAFLRRHPMSVAFYNTQEELHFLEHARTLSGDRFKVIGFDQELMGASRWLLEEVAAQHLPPATRELVNRLLAREEAAVEDARKSGRPDLLFMMVAPRDDLELLQTQLEHSHLDATPIRNLLASRDIYTQFFKNGYEGNVMRSLLMRRYFVEAGGAGRKVMLKGGTEHAFKGVNPVDNRDLGNFIAEAAEGAGVRSLHIAMIAASGEQLMFAGAGRPMKATPINQGARDSLLADFKPLLDEAEQHDAWSLFDLQPLRPQLRRLKVGRELARIILGFDYVVIVPRGHPSHEIE
jgi:hypothetical protein